MNRHPARTARPFTRDRKFLAGLASVVLCASALAVQPGRWTHTSEADFSPGKADNTVVTNLGDVKLAANSLKLAEAADPVSVINDTHGMKDGTVYIAAGPAGRLLKLTGEQLDTAAELENEQIFALDATADGRLLLGVSGEPSRLAVLDGAEVKTLATLEGVRYVWDLLVVGNTVFAATGTEGKLLSIDLADADEPKVTELFDAEQANLLALGHDGKGVLYAGSDTDGLVYRVTRAGDECEAFVIYDAPEPEIGALLVLADGTVFAGTADAEQARPGRLEEAGAAETGRPAPGEEAEAPEVPEPGDLPNVPPRPEPKDGEAPAAPDAASNAAAPEASDAPAAPAKPSPDKQLRVEGSTALALNQDAASPEATEPADAAPEPTAEQRDRLREAIRARLEQARRTGKLQVMPGRPRARAMPRMAGGSGGTTRPASPGAQAREGNAIYRIAPSGFVTEVFRESVMILKLLPHPENSNQLLVATGSEGQLYSVDHVAEETTILADFEPQQVSSILLVPDGKGQILLGTSNPAQVVQLNKAFAEEGQYTGPVLDAAQISLWGKLFVTAEVPEHTSIAVETRSGNVENPEQAAWSPWSAPQVIAHDKDAAPLAPTELTVEAPPARFLQYRLTFKGDGTTTPAAQRVELAYLVPNLKPSIASLTVSNPAEAAAGAGAPGRPGAPAAGGSAGEAEPQPVTTRTIEWEATDPNGDALVYTLEHRLAGTDAWITLAEDLDMNTHEWQTRRVPDGRYLVRLTASDARDNTPDMARRAVRQSDPVVVDNTPPAIGEPGVQVQGRNVTVSASVKDNLSRVKAVHFAVDSTEKWQPVLPEDLIYDSTSESVVVKISDLAPGPHVVTLRAVDAMNNPAYHAVTVTVDRGVARQR